MIFITHEPIEIDIKNAETCDGCQFLHMAEIGLDSCIFYDNKEIESKRGVYRRLQICKDDFTEKA